MPPYIGPAEGPQPSETRTLPPQREFFQLESGRPDYVPTPLAADNATTPDGRGYYSALFEKIESLLDDGHESRPKWLHDFALTSLMGAVHRRMWHNRSLLYAHEIAVSVGEITLDERLTQMVNAAKQGTASMDELLMLPSEVPSLPAVEIAKLSHPFRWETTFDMDFAVRQAVKRQEARTNVTWLTESQNASFKPQYSFKRSDKPLDPNALVISRKEPLAAIDGKQLVMGRNEFIIRLEEEPGKAGQLTVPLALRRHCQSLVDIQKARRFLGDNPEAKERADLAEQQLVAAIGAYIENQLSLDASERAGWLSPMSSAYYSRQLKAEERLAFTGLSQHLHESLGQAAMFSEIHTQTA